MSTQRLNLSDAYLAQARLDRGRPVGQILLERGAISARTMLGALAEAERIGQPVTKVIAAEALASRDDVLAAQGASLGVQVLRRAETVPDPAVMGGLSAVFCLEHSVLPWARIGTTTVIATARPDRFEQICTALPDGFGPVIMALTSEEDIHAEIAARHGPALARRAETLRPVEDSCRDINETTPRGRVLAVLAGLSVLLCLAFAPVLLFAVALTMALGSLLCAQVLKVSALAASRKRPAPVAPVLPRDPPKVTLLVPLFREADIARALLARLSRLSYPRALLDVVLVLEERDDQTRHTLEQTLLPPWVRVIEVPDGPITTKPRALNHALAFTDAPIIGVYDAEDSPASDQIDRVVAHFAQAPPDIGCLQGILDFYNPRANWLSRCFAVEYASWFRVLLPGLSRMGFAVPLGGTTIFFRRAALEAVHGWDAHNVTEDADLGILLARRGYRTELIASVTREEANNRVWPWIRQRSRWLKGYALTWWVHSRRPVQLWRDLGAKRFFGMQVLFLSTILQFTLAPLLWSFWLILFGLPHPLDGHLSSGLLLGLTVFFLSAEATAILVGIAAVARSPHRHLIPWVPTLFAYFPLGTLAIYKGIWEVLRNPFYWDKTTHGQSAPDTPGADIPEKSEAYR